MILFTFLKEKNMSRIIKSSDLHQGYKDIISHQLIGIKHIVQLCADRYIDDYDELIGLLAKMVSESHGYSKEEIIASINEQFE